MSVPSFGHPNEVDFKNDNPSLGPYDDSMPPYEYFIDDGDPDFNYEDIVESLNDSGQVEQTFSEFVNQSQIINKDQIFVKGINQDIQSNENELIRQNNSMKPSNMNFQHDSQYIMFKNSKRKSTSQDDDYDDEDYSFGVSRKTHRRKIDLLPQAQYLKNHYYLVFTNKKKFPKTLVKKIHRIIEGPLKIGSFTRQMTRFNDLYFEANAQNCDKILQYLVTHKEEIIAKIPELKNI